LSFEFLSPVTETNADGRTPPARSPMERLALAAGAVLEGRDGWNVAVRYGSAGREVEVCRTSAGWADGSHLGKLELQAQPEQLVETVQRAAGVSLAAGRAARTADAWWCRLTAGRALVICDAGSLTALRDRLEDAGGAGVVDVTTAYAALTIAGPLAREVIARFCAFDLRPQATPVGGFRPGSVARTPGYVLREAEHRFLVLFGWAMAQYMWTTVADSAAQLGGTPVGLDALGPLPEAAGEVIPSA
jgi:heterotetrameric sarcosine oxidase gamma subunit